jgi:hypothetical protein
MPKVERQLCCVDDESQFALDFVLRRARMRAFDPQPGSRNLLSQNGCTQGTIASNQLESFVRERSEEAGDQ